MIHRTGAEAVFCAHFTGGDAGLVVIGDAFLALLDGAGHRLVHADERAGAIIQQRVHAGVKQRQPMLHACIGAGIGNGFVERVFLADSAEQLAVLLTEALGGGGAELHLAHGEQHEGIQRVFGALGEGVETAQGLDFVAEQVDAHAFVVAGGNDVDGAAAHGEFAGFHGFSATAVALRGQERHQLFVVQLAADAQAEADLAHGAARREFLQYGARGGDDYARAAAFGIGGEGREGAHACRHEGRMRRSAVVGHAIPGGEGEYLYLGGKKAQGIGKGFHGAVVDGDVQQQAGFAGAHAPGQQFGQHQRFRAGGNTC